MIKERKPYNTPKECHSALIRRRGGYHATTNKEYDTAALSAEFDYEVKDIVDRIKERQLTQSGGYENKISDINGIGIPARKMGPGMRLIKEETKDE